ncbi:alpha/beta hydrolase fold [Parvibaculum lavamentivorans DS-1]|uniref:Alpha/beta hydrolase fold n=1 Tax=Parvibaculum lavamentivorans (strain DS-1 / DSM 13023 / NCIMB 13966) TaxID=402881 RepID=A7HSJ9_PARL1|nr:alpha/beta fold hydrolase [Parvibaculum lavamentivorans]ABS62882.1 alpha/beta hydrolase fold [Parvibaculum lavamentivorans DS-1]
MKILPLALLFALAFAADAMAEPWSEREVTVDGGLAPLHGTLTLPEGDGPVDAALILPGSGPTDRNGNFPEGNNNSLRLLARSLGDAGIASLRIDKRGVGASAQAAPKEEDLRAETYVDDAVQWLEFLDKEPRIRRLYLIGHSEGALLATLAAQKKPVAGLVLIAAIGRPAPDVLREQVATGNMEPQLRQASDTILAKLERGETHEEVPGQLDALYRPSVQPYLISWFKYDPAAELAKLSMPVLLIRGTHDLQVRQADADALAAARPDATLLAIEEMNHVLKIAPADRAENIRFYSDPGAPLAPGLADAITDFISKMTAP